MHDACATRIFFHAVLQGLLISVDISAKTVNIEMYRVYHEGISGRWVNEHTSSSNLSGAMSGKKYFPL